MVYVLYSRLGKTMQKDTKLVCRKTLTRHLIGRKALFPNPFSLGYNNGWRHKLDPCAYQWFTSTLLDTYSTPTRLNSDPLWLFMLLYFKFIFNFNDTPVSNTRTLPVNIYFNDTLVNSTRTHPVNIFTCAWKTEKPCKLQYNSLTVFWLVSLWCNWVQMSCSLSVAYW